MAVNHGGCAWSAVYSFLAGRCRVYGNLGAKRLGEGVYEYAAHGQQDKILSARYIAAAKPF